MIRRYLFVDARSKSSEVSEISICLKILIFSRRMAKAGQVVTLRPPVITSSRRFSAPGETLTTLSDVWLTFRYLRGEDPNMLAEERRALRHETEPYHDQGLKQRTLKS